MVEKSFDDDWFLGYRHHLLQIPSYAMEERRPHAIHNLLHGAYLDGAADRQADHELRRLPHRHAGAVRAHLQFYRACLTATGLLPADPLVRAAVQIELFWHDSAFTTFYRDHLAHVMKVAAIGLSLLQDADSPLADGRPLVKSVAEDLASGKLGSPAIRAAARRAGNTAQTLGSVVFWEAAVLETIRLAGLLHDMAHPAVIASKMSRIAMPLLPRAPFEPSEEELCKHSVAAFGYRLLAAPFNGGILPDSKGLAADDALVCADVFQQSHSLRAGYAVIGFADEADRVWQLGPFDAFVMEWAALAVSLHDYDKLLVPRQTERPEDDRLRLWLADPRHAAAMRPCYARDPVSYLLAFADRLQEFGRVLGPVDTRAGGADVRYPCRAVRLRADRGARDSAAITVVIGADEPTCFGADDEDHRRIAAYKQEEASRLFGEGGWLDGEGLFVAVTLDVVRAPARVSSDPSERRGASARAEPVRLFYSFAARDEEFRQALETHLSGLKWEPVIADWHHRLVSAGEDWQSAANEHLEAAEIILLLISADFMASDYCGGHELASALGRHHAGTARVIPVLVRAFDLTQVPALASLVPLPSNGVPVASWHDRDEAWADVARGIRRVVDDIRTARAERAR